MKSTSKKMRLLRWGLLTLSILMVGAGIWRQEPLGVLQKAVTICLECIGIG